MLSKAKDKISSLLAENKHLADAATAVLVRVLAAVLAYGVQVFLARVLGMGEYGVYVTLWTWLGIATHIAVFGFSESSIRFIPRYTERTQFHWAAGFLKTGYWVVSVGAVLIAALSLAFLSYYGDVLPDRFYIPVVVLAIGLPFFALELYLEGVSRSFGWYLLTMLPTYVIRPLLIAVGVLLLSSLGYDVDAATVLGLAVVITAMTVLVLSTMIYLRVRKQFDMSHRDVLKSNTQRLWVRASLPLLFIVTLDELYFWSDILILGFLVPSEEVSVYFAALRAMSLASFIQYAFMLVSSREFSLANAMRDKEELQRRISQAVNWSFWLTVPAVLLTFSMGYPLLWMFGEGFTAGLPVMGVLGIAFIIRASVGQAAELLVVLGYQRVNLLVSLCGLVLNVVLSVIMVPMYGVIGAAIATAISFIVRAFVLSISIRRLTGLRVAPGFSLK